MISRDPLTRWVGVRARICRFPVRWRFFFSVRGGMGVQANRMKQRGMRTLIVDDEPIARQIMREHLEAFPEVDVIGEAADGKEALEKIRKYRPELVFLDLQMPVMGGFDVVRALGPGPVPVWVIVTAYDEHAIQAFESGAMDYLLKPVSEARLRRAVERAVTLRNRPAGEVAKIASLGAALPVSSWKIVGRSDGEYVLLDAAEVLAFQADAELVWIVTATHRLLADQPLRAIEHRFEGTEFRRVHRNAIVNINHVKKMTVITSQRWLITLTNSLQLVVSKRQARTIRKLLLW
jgi:two-component system LytT family response regulator